MKDIITVSCPNCGKPVDVNKALSQQLQDEYRSKYLQQVADAESQFKTKNEALTKLSEELEQKSSSMQLLIDKAVQDKLSSHKQKMEKSISERVAEEKKDEILSYQEQLAQKVQEVRDLNKLKAEFQRLQREKEELKGKIEVESEKRLTVELEKARKLIKAESENSFEMKLTEREHIIKQLKDQLKLAQRKAEQGSMQLQGEVQELAIEKFLQESFPTDTIQEVKKGAKGADCLQIVNSAGFENCGRIYYESKRTKDFQRSWLNKFKTDMRQANAHFGVLVTDNLPKEMKRMGQLNGIWVCTYEEFKGLCHVLREFVIMLHRTASSEEDKGSKMELLYSYFTGNEFRMYIETVVESFTNMHHDMLKEKRSMESIWKMREKELQKVLLSTSQMYGAIRGIAGKSLSPIKALELPEKNSNSDEQ